MSWKFKDQFPNLRLLEIVPLSARAKSWLARASLNDRFSEETVAQIAGSIFMLEGLDYHYNNFMSYFDRLELHYKKQESYLKKSRNGDKNDLSYSSMTKAQHKTFDYLTHEAIAYINRIGQFYYFAKSEPFKLDSLMPRVSELMLFRNKHTAHRSIDKPRNDDGSEVYRLWQTTSFGFHKISINFFPVFQISNNEKHIQFHMRDDHPIIMKQALSVLQTIHSMDGDALI